VTGRGAERTPATPRILMTYGPRASPNSTRSANGAKLNGRGTDDARNDLVGDPTTAATTPAILMTYGRTSSPNSTRFANGYVTGGRTQLGARGSSRRGAGASWLGARRLGTKRKAKA
jgi:hypothetical protein